MYVFYTQYKLIESVFKVLSLYGVLVYIFYKHNVVGEVVYFKNDIYVGAM